MPGSGNEITRESGAGSISPNGPFPTALPSPDVIRGSVPIRCGEARHPRCHRVAETGIHERDVARTGAKRRVAFCSVSGRGSLRCAPASMTLTVRLATHVITGLVPAIWIVRGATLVRIGMAGTSPAMTWEGDGKGVQATLCSHFVLDNTSQSQLYPCLRSAPDEGRACEASQCGSRHGPVARAIRRCVSTGGPGCVLLNRDWSQAAADVAVPAWRSRRTSTACPPKKAVREAASRLFHSHHASASRAALRATLDLTKGSAHIAAGPRVLAVRHRSLTPTARHPLAVMAGLRPATHVLRPASLPRRGSPGRARG